MPSININSVDTINSIDIIGGGHIINSSIGIINTRSIEISIGLCQYVKYVMNQYVVKSVFEVCDDITCDDIIIISVGDDSSGYVIITVITVGSRCSWAMESLGRKNLNKQSGFSESAAWDDWSVHWIRTLV